MSPVVNSADDMVIDAARLNGAPGRLLRRVLAALVLCGCIGAALTFNQSAVHWRADSNDSHYYAYCGWRVSQGAIPYVDVWNNKPPGAWWLNALGFHICGTGPNREILICSVALAITILGFIAVSRTAYEASLWPLALIAGCVILTQIRYQCGGNRTETFVVPCEILGVLGYLRWRRGGGWGWLAGGCFFAGAAPLFKQAGLAALGACTLHFAWSLLMRLRSAPARDAGPLWKPWLIGGLAAATPLLLTALILAAQGALGEAYFAVWKFNRAYFEVNDATWFSLGRAVDSYREAASPLHGLGLLACAGLFMAMLRRREKYISAEPRDLPGPGLFFIWLLLTFYFAGVSPGRQPYHLATALAPLGLLALYPLNRLVDRRTLGRRIVARPSMAVVVVLYLYVLAALGGENFRQASACWTVKPRWCALRRDPPAAYEVQAAEIRRMTGPEDTIYVWGWSPGTYRYALRHSVSRFSTLEKLGQVGEHAEFIYFGAILDIREKPPTVFVISGGDLRAMLTPPMNEFARWISDEYADHGDFEGMHILVRKASKP